MLLVFVCVCRSVSWRQSSGPHADPDLRAWGGPCTKLRTHQPLTKHAKTLSIGSGCGMRTTPQPASNRHQELPALLADMHIRVCGLFCDQRTSGTQVGEHATPPLQRTQQFERARCTPPNVEPARLELSETQTHQGKCDSGDVQD